MRPRAALVLFALALALRLLYLWQVHDSPLFDVLVIDSAYYDRRGAAIAAGDWVGGEVFFMAPLYEYFLGVLYTLLGRSWVVVAALQAVLGATSVVLTYSLGVRLFDHRTGLGAGLAAAVYAPFVFYDGALLTASLIGVLNLAGLLLLFGALESERPCPGRLVAAGVLFGLSALARANVLLFVALVPVGLWGRLSSWRGGLKAGALVVAGTLLALAPATVRNALVGGELVLTSSNAGMNFYTGNHPGAQGVYTPPEFLSSAEPAIERADYLAEAARRLGHPVGAGEASRFWFAEGLGFLRTEPGEAAAVVGKKLYALLNRTEAPTNLGYHFAQDFSWLLRVLPLGFGIVAPFGLIGLGLARRRGLGLVHLYLATYLATCLVFFVSSEYRLPMVPLLLILGVHALRRAADWRGASLALWTPVLAALLFACNWRAPMLERLTRRRVDYLNFATVYLRQGELEKAEAMLDESLAIDPDFPPARTELAAIYRQTGREAEAERLLEGLAQRQLLARARMAFDAGDWAGAERGYRQALAAGAERSSRVLTQIGVCALEQGEPARAAVDLRRALEEGPGSPRAHYHLARALLALGDRTGARGELEATLARKPDHAEARRLLEELSGG